MEQIEIIECSRDGWELGSCESFSQIRIEYIPIESLDIPFPRTSHKRLMELIDGAVFLSQTPNIINLSLICELINVGSCLRISMTLVSISGEVLRGFEPPITPGRNDPVSS